MTTFILNQTEVSTSEKQGITLLDFIRYHQQLTGTKIGCREGDCGACTVVIGEYVNGSMKYFSATSCLTPIGNVQGKHVVSIEGVNKEIGLNKIQQAMSDEAATQCGFCTIGFEMSLTAFALNFSEHQHDAKSAIDGNICRCTGYKSIERAAKKVELELTSNTEKSRLQYLVDADFIPSYFLDIPERLKKMQDTIQATKVPEGAIFVSGGTDLYVQKHDAMHEAEINFLSQQTGLKGITLSKGICTIGAASSITDLMESSIIREGIPQFYQFAKLVSSTPIRNIATLGGNFTNASPIGDFSIFFLALNAELVLSNGASKRSLPLKDYYLAYKTLNKSADEYIHSVTFEMPKANAKFNFEKVSKRTYLDIASVNTALQIELDHDFIVRASLSAGGVAPIPLFLKEASTILIGKALTAQTVQMLITTAQEEVQPISDVRGTVAYKRLLLTQLIKAHFIQMFPDRFSLENLI